MSRPEKQLEFDFFGLGDREAILDEIDPDWRLRFFVHDEPFAGAPDPDAAWEFYQCDSR